MGHNGTFIDMGTHFPVVVVVSPPPLTLLSGARASEHDDNETSQSTLGPLK